MSNDAVAAMKAAREAIENFSRQSIGCMPAPGDLGYIALQLLDAAIKAQEEAEMKITYEASMSSMFNGIPIRHAGARPWPEYPSSADDEATRWRHGEPASEPPEPPWSMPPFANCSFNICDLRGQCMKEGRCHHPKDEPPRFTGTHTVSTGAEYPIETIKRQMPEPATEPQGDADAWLGWKLNRDIDDSETAFVTLSKEVAIRFSWRTPEPLSLPRPAAQISDERIREIGKDVFGIDLNFDGNLITFARALLREAAPKEGA